eukprot:SAG11_NODE_15761_length_567_cov_0.989316_2_plen_81_part_01
MACTKYSAAYNEWLATAFPTLERLEAGTTYVELLAALEAGECHPCVVYGVVCTDWIAKEMQSHTRAFKKSRIGVSFLRSHS